jgi:hypothetical protein
MWVRDFLMLNILSLLAVLVAVRTLAVVVVLAGW